CTEGLRRYWYFDVW
nr:immunoglobulin heavy chain junction region [Mus musculus]